MRLIDVHCHLESDYFVDDLAAVIGGAKDAGVVKLITASIHPGQWTLSRRIAEQFPEVEFALGVHPWYIREEYFNELPALRHAKGMGAVAIGEIGIDRKVRDGDFNLQIKFFEAQLEIARDAGLPVIIHCRGAFNDLVLSLKRVGAPEPGGIIHSFSGSREIAETLMRLGLSFSLGGILTYRHSKKRAEMLASIYPGHFLLETDSPDIPPVQKSGDINYPCNITFNLQAAAEILGDTTSNVARHTTDNAARIFNLELN